MLSPALSDDPAKALASKQDFQKENREAINERRARMEDQGGVVPQGEGQDVLLREGRSEPGREACARKADFYAGRKFIGAGVLHRRIDRIASRPPQTNFHVYE